jgi:hypothetical protein
MQVAVGVVFIRVTLVLAVLAVELLESFLARVIMALQIEVVVAAVLAPHHLLVETVAQASLLCVTLALKKAQAVQLLAQVVTLITPSQHLAHTQHKDKTCH